MLIKPSGYEPPGVYFPKNIYITDVPLADITINKRDWFLIIACPTSEQISQIEYEQKVIIVPFMKEWHPKWTRKQWDRFTEGFMYALKIKSSPNLWFFVVDDMKQIETLIDQLCDFPLLSKFNCFTTSMSTVNMTNIIAKNFFKDK